MVTVTDEWTEVLSDGHSETTYTVIISGEDIYLTTKQTPQQPVVGIPGEANDWLLMTVEQDEPLFARSRTDGTTATVRVVGGIHVKRQPRKKIDADVSEPLTLENTSGTSIDPATEGTLSSTLAREIATWSAGTLPVEQQTDVAVTPSAAGGLPVEQQTPVGVESAAGTQIDPRQQPQYATAYTAIDLNTAATTTVYAPTNDATVSGVHLANPGTAAEVRLEVTDGTNTAVLADPGAGSPVHFSDEVRLSGGTDSLQIVVEAAEGSALSETAAVSRGEL